MKFLQTITVLGDELLIPIDRIKYISVTAPGNHWEIKILSDENGESIECFDFSDKSQERLNARLEEIKKIIEAE